METSLEKIVSEGLNKDSLERLLNEAPYSTDPEEDRVNALSMYLYFLQSFSDLHGGMWSYEDRDDDGTKYKINFIYATDYPFLYNQTGLKYLWVDVYEEDKLVSSSLEDVLYKKFLFTSETAPISYFNALLKLLKDGSLKQISIDDII